MNQKEHFRKCHICETVNCAEGQLVTQCKSCGKHLAPFYFFDESKAMGLPASSKSSSEVSAKTKLPHREYPPVWGLTAYWE